MSEHQLPHEEEHRNVTGGVPRAAIFGVSDGLVTNISLILGFAGANPSAGIVRLAGVAGLVAGAFSMASGEYLSMQAQSELFERELSIERKAIAEHPDLERAELIQIYETKGIETRLAQELADVLMSNPEIALETHAREELGIDPAVIGSAWKAAIVSFFTFAIGAFIPLIPWLFTRGTAAVVGSIVLGTLAALSVGALLSQFTGRSVFVSALRQLVVAACAAGVTFAVGYMVGMHI